MIRQDLTHFAWGVTLEGSTPSTFYRRDEIDTGRDGFPYLTAFVEWRSDPRTALSLTLDNTAGLPARRERTFFSPDPRTPDPALFEYRERNTHIVPLLTFNKDAGVSGRATPIARRRPDPPCGSVPSAAPAHAPACCSPA